MENTNNETGPTLNWKKSDIEQRFGFRGAKYTDVNPWCSLMIGLILLCLFYVALLLLKVKVPDSFLANQYLDRPNLAIPFLIAFFTAWAAAILFVKWRKYCLQRRALKIAVVPSSRDFVLSAATAPAVLKHMYQCVDNPAHFILMSRIERALSNLRNIGRVSDVIDMLQSQAQNDEDQMESSYTILRGMIWCVPILGFIGTVLGLSIAMVGFGPILSQGHGGEPVNMALQSHLSVVIGGLSTAFETTLQGLVASLTIQLLLTGLKKKEEQFLDDCKEYCHANIISRLRLIHLEEDVGASEH